MAVDAHVGRGTRVAQAARAIAAVLLALAAAALVTWLAERGPRLRLDLTRDERNTLDPSSEQVLAALPRDVRADVFFTAAEPPFEAAGLDVQERTLRLLRLFADASGGRFAIVEHDLSDRARIAVEAQLRLRELGLLGLEPGGLVALSCGARREILRLRGDLADLDPGNADPRQGPVAPASVVHYRGEEALLGAVLDVSEERTPLAVLARGHGELATNDQGARGAALFARELAASGFRTVDWDGAHGDRLPPACDVLVLLGPTQRFAPGELAEIEAYASRGGRALVALSTESAAGGAGELLARFGVVAREPGFVCAPFPTVTGELRTGVAECALVTVGLDGIPARNLITDPLRAANRRAYLFRSRALVRGTLPPRGRVVELLRAPPEAWLELPADDGNFDLAPDAKSERGRHALAMQASFPSETTAESADAPEARLVALGSADALANHLFPSNRDLVVNALDWLVEREHRVRVTPKSPEARRLDLSQPGAVARVHFVAVLLVPGLCLALGLLTAWRRRRA